ncbi:hypothetical protein ACLK1T_29300 [Escherichia coli]
MKNMAIGTIARAVDKSPQKCFRKEYAEVFEGTAEWKGINVARSDTYGWQEDSTYIRLSPFFDEMQATPAPSEDAAVRGSSRCWGIQSPLTISLRRAVLSPTAGVDLPVGVLSKRL